MDRLPPAIKAKITRLINDAKAEAFAGAQPPEEAQQLRDDLEWARYCLEQTILTHLKRNQ